MSSKRARRHQILVLANNRRRKISKQTGLTTHFRTGIPENKDYPAKYRDRNIEAEKARWFRKHYPLNGRYKDEKTIAIYEIVALLEQFGHLKGVKKIK